MLLGSYLSFWGLSEESEHPMDIFPGHVLCSLEQLASCNSFSFLVGSWGFCCALFSHGRENMAGVMDKHRCFSSWPLSWHICVNKWLPVMYWTKAYPGPSSDLPGDPWSRFGSRFGTGHLFPCVNWLCVGQNCGAS